MNKAISYQFRYSFTPIASRILQTSSLIPQGDDVDLTYSQLFDEHFARLKKENPIVSQQSLRNQTSSLNTYLAFIGKGMGSRVGRELLSEFSQKSKEFLLLACPENKKTAADKMSHLRSWKKTLDSILSKSKRATTLGASQFHIELRAAIVRSGIPPKTLARQVAGSTSALQRWLCGAYPNERSLPTLRRVEKGLGLSRGALENLLPKAKLLGSSTIVSKDNFAKRLAENVKDHYRVRMSETTPTFQEEWLSLLRYKTSEFPVGLRRSARGVWRTLPLDKVSSADIKKVWTRVGDAHSCPTAGRELDGFLAFFGYLTRTHDCDVRKSGQGLPLEDILTLASIAMPEFVAGFFEYIKARSGGLVHGTHRTIASSFRSLLNPTDGYLVQQPTFFQRIKKYAGGRTWEQLCAQTFELCGKWKQASAGKKSRDPKSPIHGLLRLESPLGPLFRAVKDLDNAAGAAAPGSVLQASLKRDALLLSIAIANPLRARTFTIAKYIDEGSERIAGAASNLYRTETGGWRLRFEKGDFKNDGSRHEDYDAPLPKMLNERIEEYLQEFRPVLIKNQPDAPWLFPSSKTGERLGSIGQIFARIAKRYVPEVARMRGHALRHLVATDFLAKNPGLYTVVAELLHDRLDTVLANYAHLKAEKAFQAHEEHLERVLSAS